MKKSEVRKRALEFCKENNIKTFPVEIIKACNKLGLKVFEEYLDPDVSGMIIVDNEPWERYGTNKFIVVNLSELATRRRFTIAHELAHYVLHKEGNVLYAHRDMVGNSAVQSNIEQEANYFAANVLMPEKLVEDKVNDIKEEAWGILPNFVLIKEIADSFAVSESAAEVRLKQLKLI